MKRLLALVGLGMLAAAALVLPIGPSGAGVDAGQAVYVVHGIAGLPVDVCVGDETTPAIPNLQPGDVVEPPLALPADDYDISLHTVGENCADLLYEETVTVGVGSSTIVAWNEGPASDVDPDLIVFTNNVTCTQPGTGRVTARHVAGAAERVDAFAGATEIVSDLDPGEQATLDVPVGTYPIEVKLDGGGATVLGPADVPVQEGKNIIVHVVNALEEGGQPAGAIVLIIDVGVCAAQAPPAPIQTPARFTG